MAAQRLDGSLRMIALLRAHGADDRQLVHVPGDTWKNLGNLHAGGIRRDGSETAVRFNVPGVEMAEAAFEPQQNTGLGFAGCGGREGC